MNHDLMLAIFDVGGQEMLLILVVMLILFGAKRLPEMARNLGKSVETFKRAAQNVRTEIMNADPDESSKPVAQLPHPAEEPPVIDNNEAGMAEQPVEEQTAPGQSKAEITLGAAATPPAGTVSQNESHDQKTAESA